ncbi:MAG TPA: hypothetical protein VK668_22865 [Mucilaginibacter sp.]|nr:hypothetical protein [Mucilaginibacter sp.]
MKIRIKGSSLRYRLTKSDVSHFEEHGYIEDHTNFAGQTLIYALQRNTGNNLSATFKNDKITLFMPDSLSSEWISTDIVGFENYDDQLLLLVEKDFKCLDNVAEDQSDNYPNPLVKSEY